MMVRLIASSCMAAALLCTQACRQPDTKDQTAYTTPADSALTEQPSERYGIPLAPYTLSRGTIAPNQFLADILLDRGVPYQSIATLAHVAKDVYNVRKLKAGDPYTLFCARDSAATLCFMVVETSRSEYVVYQLSDSISARLGSKPVSIVPRKAYGVIHSSLYETINENNLPLSLAYELSQIYAWTIDFYRIQEGDNFSVLFDEAQVEGKSVGIHRIHAATFTHGDEVFEAYRFEHEGKVDFYDEKGESLRKAFLKAPLAFSRISSRYTLKRFHPVQRRWKAHLGTDYAAPTGTPIMSTGDGKVIESRYSRFNGNYVKIRHNSTYTTQYLHMSKRKVAVGETVKQGDVIGLVGSTGLATGPHVCYRFWKNGKQVDPYRQDLPPSTPVPERYLQQFELAKDSLRTLLLQLRKPDTALAGTQLSE